MRSSLHWSTRRELPAGRLSSSALAVLAALAPLSAHAQSTDGTVLAPVVVTSSRTAQPLTETLAHTTVVTQEDIFNSQAPDVRTLLRNQAGVEFSTTGGMGSTTSIFMRGANSNQTLVLIDGVRISSSSTGMAQLENLLPDQIDHIEVVRGNVSALYGSDAIGGVVQIFTKSGVGQQPGGTAQVEYGTDNTRRATAGYGGQVGGTSFNLTGSIFKTDGFSAINAEQWNRDHPAIAAAGSGPNPGRNPYDNKSVSGQLRHQFGSGWDAGVAAYYTDSKFNYDSLFGTPTDTFRTDSELYTVSAFVNGKVLPDWTTHFKVAQSEDRSQNVTNGVPDSLFVTRNQQFTWQNEYALAPQHTLLFGTDYLHQELAASDNFGTNFSPTRNDFSVYGGYEGRIGRNQVQLNLRNDHYSDFGNQFSGRLGYGFDVTNEFKLIASLSNAFRAPTFNELYFPGFGNPNLQPERAKSAEAGVQYKSAQAGLLRVTAFETKYDNLIVSGPLFIPVNANRAKVQGIEASWRATLWGTDLGASVTFQNPVDEQSNQQLLRRARRYASFDAGRYFGKVRLGAEWLLSSSRRDLDTNSSNSLTLGGYGIVNLTARYDIDKQWFIAARVENLFDKQYQLAYPYNTQGLAGFVTLGWRQR